jgi:hypothetical protein
MEVMPAWRRAIELSLGDEDTAKLKSMAQSRTEPASRVERARILLAYREDPSFFAVGRALGRHAARQRMDCGEGKPSLREEVHQARLDLVDVKDPTKLLPH